MSKLNISFMTDEALETLKKRDQDVTKMLIENPDSGGWLTPWLKDFANDIEIFTVKKYQIEKFQLKKYTDDDNENKRIRYENAITLYENLKHLPRYILTDERFWLWFNFEIGYEAALQYMPINEGSKKFLQHWLFSGGRRRGLFFGVLSRDFFYVDLTVQDDKEDKYSLTRFVFENTVRIREFTWRTFSSQKHLVKGALKGEQRFINKHKIEKTTAYPEIAKKLSQLGSVKFLDKVSEDEIENFVFGELEKLNSVDAN